jgi:hypothetical protein
MARTISGIPATASAGGRTTMSTPSPRMFSSESVTRAATSTSASVSRLSPVISQSIQTMRSFTCFTVLVDVRGRGPGGPVGSIICRIACKANPARPSGTLLSPPDPSAGQPS